MEERKRDSQEGTCGGNGRQIFQRLPDQWSSRGSCAPDFSPERCPTPCPGHQQTTRSRPKGRQRGQRERPREEGELMGARRRAGHNAIGCKVRAEFKAPLTLPLLPTNRVRTCEARRAPEQTRKMKISRRDTHLLRTQPGRARLPSQTSRGVSCEPPALPRHFPWSCRCLCQRCGLRQYF